MIIYSRVHKNHFNIFQVKKPELEQSSEIEQDFVCKTSRNNHDSTLKNKNLNIPKSSILLNFDENFRIKMPPVPVIKPKNALSSLTPFQKIEIRKSDDKELLRKRVTMNKLEFYRKEAYLPEELKRKILLKRKNFEDPGNIPLTNTSHEISKNLKISKMKALPILDFQKALPFNSSNLEILKFKNSTERLKMQTISEFLNKEINLISPIPKSTKNKKNNLFDKTRINLKRNNSTKINLLSKDHIEKGNFKLNYKMITLN